MTVAGGERMRLINDSVRVAIIAALEELGWLDATVYDDPPGTRRHRPLSFASYPEEWMDEIAVNTFSITMEDLMEEEAELGGQAVDDTHTFFFDIFGENESLSKHIAWDVHDFLVAEEYLDVFDLRQATPAVFQRLEVERASVVQIDGFRRPWQQFWWTVRFDLIDDHTDTDAVPDLSDVWSDGFADAWVLIQEVI